MGNFGIFKGFSDKLFEGELPTQLGKIGSESFGFTGLLDDYPNAAAAYSLRKLRADYTGSAIRVRRSSDNTEQDIGFNTTGNLDTSSLTSFCGSGDGFVTTWYDQSGTANNAIQTTAANQPQIVSSGNVLILNSKPRLAFDGSNDRFNFTEISGVTGMSLISVHKFNFISSSLDAYGGSDTILAYTAGFIKDMSIGGRQSKAQIYYEDGTIKFIAESSIATGNQYVQFGYVSTSGAGISTNGSLKTGSSGLNTSIVRAIAQDNGSAYFNGDIQEIIIYTNSQSSNRTGIESNINTYYGIY